MRRRVTFSRNYTLSLSRTCHCYCKYCAFATHKAHLLLARRGRASSSTWRCAAARQGAAGPHRRAPGGRSRRRARACAEYGHEDFTAYVVWACERALERGLLPHTNLGVLDRDGPRAAARGDGLAGADARVDLRAADGDRPRRLADEAPARRLETIRAAGELRIPFTSGILVGIGETEDERIALARGARRGARRARPHPGGDPPELRPARALLRPRAGADRRRRPRSATGATGIGEQPDLPLPEWACEVTSRT